MAAIPLTGGRVNYYLIRVEHPQRENQEPYTAECEDLIHAAKMTFDEACEFKAIWRTAVGRLIGGKPGITATYDAEKRVHYATRDLKHYRLADAQKLTAKDLGPATAQSDDGCEGRNALPGE